MNLSNNTYIAGDSRQITQLISLWLSERYRRLRALWAHRRGHARQLQELYRSSDRELLDMGLTRSDLPEIARGTYRRE